MLGPAAAPQPAQQLDIQKELPQFPVLIGTNGTLRHGTHLADLTLEAALPKREFAWRQFQDVVHYLVSCLEVGHVPFWSEKIDGSPALILGHSADIRPFVAYKGGIDRKGPQQLFVDEASVASASIRDVKLRGIYNECVKELLAAQQDLDPQIAFQGDLLFTSSNGARTVSDQGLVLKANRNGLSYSLRPESEFFSQASAAPIGIAIHSAFDRKIDDSRVSLVPRWDPDAVTAVVRALQARGVFAVDPFHREISVPRISTERAQSLQSEVAAIATTVGLLPPAFAEEWAKVHPTVATYLNSELYPPRKGGLFRAVAQGEAIDADKFRAGLISWMIIRQTTGSEERMKAEKAKLERTILPFLEQHGESFNQLLSAYFRANQIIHALLTDLKPVFCSKLGGGPIEGIMFGPIKLVDRLGFTMLNFSGTREAREQGAKLPKPFHRPELQGTYLLIKGQPLHRGHVAMIKQAAAEAGGEMIHVVTSILEPKLTAEVWRDLKLAETKKELKAQDYKYPLPISIRRRMMRAAFAGEPNITVHFTPPGNLMRYLQRAKADGKAGQVTLVVSEREIKDKRYDGQVAAYRERLALKVMPIQANDLSGTAVRKALKKAALSREPKSYQFLREALDYIKPVTRRDGIIRDMVKAWKLADAAAHRVLKLEAEKKVKKVKS